MTKKFDLSRRIGFISGDVLMIEDVKEFIKKGDKIFHLDYGNDEVTTEEYDYAVKKWEEFKKLAGEELK